MKISSLKRIGRKGKADKLAINQGDKVLRELGIYWCELNLPGCMGKLMLSRAHRKKRRFCDFEELTKFCLACASCHGKAEVMTHEEMFELINAAIERRNLL